MGVIADRVGHDQFDPIGLKGLQWEFSWRYRDSELDDPLTGEARQISDYPKITAAHEPALGRARDALVVHRRASRSSRTTRAFRPDEMSRRVGGAVR